MNKLILIFSILAFPYIAKSESTNIFQRPTIPVTVVKQPDISRQKQAILESFMFALPTNNQFKISYICSSIKVTNSEIPPLLYEEIIVLAERTKGSECYLACLDRTLSLGTCDKRWNFSYTVQEMNSVKKYMTKPKPADICSFLDSTNFGNNEYDPSTSVILLRLNSEFADKQIINTLNKTLPVKVLMSRKKAFDELFDEPPIEIKN
jgi:hypothetical protein